MCVYKRDLFLRILQHTGVDFLLQHCISYAFSTTYYELHSTLLYDPFFFKYMDLKKN